MENTFINALLIILFLFIIGCDSSTNPEDEVNDNIFCADVFERILCISDTTDTTHIWNLDFNFIYHLENTGGSLLSYSINVISLSTVNSGIKGMGWGWQPRNVNVLTYLKPNERDTISKLDHQITIVGSRSPIEFSFFLEGVYHNDSTFSTFDSTALDGFFYTFQDTIYP